MPRKAKVVAKHPVAEDYASLIQLLMEMRPRLSKRLQQIAKFFMNNPEDIAIYNIVEIAVQAEVHPSAITRFSKELGFAGFNDLQNVFRQRLVGPKATYAERMKALIESNEPRPAGDFDLHDPSVVFDTFINAAMDALLRIRGHRPGISQRFRRGIVKGSGCSCCCGPRRVRRRRLLLL